MTGTEDMARERLQHLQSHLRLPCPVAYYSLRCQAAGTSSSSTAGYAAAWSVTTSTGVAFVMPMACSKNRRAAFATRRVDTNTSMTCPNWSIAW